MHPLLKAILERARKGTHVKGQRFGYGIQTAAGYVKTISECVGSDMCYRFAASKTISFDDVVKKAARTLVYSSPGMRGVVEKAKSDLASLKDVQVPKNTLMVFRHKLTTPRKDRDGDVLRSEGAKPDPNMLLLWQHMPTLPIGKLLVVENQSAKSLEVASCIVDMNALCHDAAVMVDNDMGRFSHGFKALDFEEIRDGKGHTCGYDVKEFEIMEESLVSIPSNIDADTSEIVLSLVEGGKLTSPLMKEFGKTIRSKRPKSIASPGLPGEKNDKTKQQPTCGCGGATKDTRAKTGNTGSAPTKSKAVPKKPVKRKTTKHSKVKKSVRTLVFEAKETLIRYSTYDERASIIDVLQSLNDVERKAHEAEMFSKFCS